MKNILILNKYYYPVIGGVETVVELYADHLSKKNNVKVLVCNKTNNERSSSIYVNDRLNIIYSKTVLTIQKLPISIIFFYNFYKLRNWADIVYVHEPFPLGMFVTLFVKKNKKIVVTWHSDILSQKFLGYIVKPLQNKLLKKANVITTTSNNLLNYSSQLQLQSDKVQIIPLSIDTEKISNSNIEVKIGDDLRDILKRVGNYCLYFGRLSYYKGLDTLIKVYEKNDSDLIPILIAGEGELDMAIYNLQERLPKKLFFLNRFLTEDEKFYVISKCLFFVFPSNKITEAFGITQLEAMFFSKPVINTNLPTGVSWVSIHNLTGITVEPDNENSFYDAIKRLTLDSDYREVLGKNAKLRVLEYFSTRKVIGKLEDIFDNL
jgi:rhamnosyl/mannosyltransferase